MIRDVFAALGYASPGRITQFRSEEDQSFYKVWKVDYPDISFVLKQAKGQELDLYRTYFSKSTPYAPQILAHAEVAGEHYILMEFIPGHNLMKCTRDALRRTLNSLIAMQKSHWMHQDSINSYEARFISRKNRQNYLPDVRLQLAYDAYLSAYETMPRTLCHDDLLPFNVIVSEETAVLIDWEVGGILPYLTPFARLIAHTDENENALFCMKNADKEWAIEYYFQHFAADFGVSRSQFLHDLDLFLFYEFCEWVYVGNRYKDTDNTRYQTYLHKALQQAEKLGF